MYVYIICRGQCLCNPTAKIYSLTFPYAVTLTKASFERFFQPHKSRRLAVPDIKPSTLQ